MRLWMADFLQEGSTYLARREVRDCAFALFGRMTIADHVYRVEEEKSAAVEWFPLDALPDPVVPHERAVFDLLRTGVPAIMASGFEPA